MVSKKIHEAISEGVHEHFLMKIFDEIFGKFALITGGISKEGGKKIYSIARELY